MDLTKREKQLITESLREFEDRHYQTQSEKETAEYLQLIDKIQEDD